MNPQFSDQAVTILNAVRQSLTQGQKGYLVGGAVRDLVLGRPLKDFDFVVANGSIELAHKVRRKLGGSGFTLDDERKTARVLLSHGKPDELILDFVSFTGRTLEEDLKNRDFTINTLAIDLDSPQEIIDLLGGRQDLKLHVLRAASEYSFKLDPLRVLRGARMMLKYDLSLEVETDEFLRASLPGLKMVSGERIRDEIFKIIELPGRKRSLSLLNELDVLNVIFPGIAALKSVPPILPHVHALWEHTLATVNYLEGMMEPEGSFRVAPQLQWHWEYLSERLEPYHELLSHFFATPIQGGRSRLLLFFIGALYHDVGKPEARSLGKDGRSHFTNHPLIGKKWVGELDRALMLGQAEDHYLSTLVGQHMRVHFLARQLEGVSKRAIYRYFKDLGDVGVDVALLSLADTLATWEESLPESQWQREVGIAIEMLAAWFQQRQSIVAPTKLLDGDDLMHMLGLKGSPLLGELLEMLREAQAAGEIDSREAALDFLRAELQKRSGKENRYD